MTNPQSHRGWGRQAMSIFFLDLSHFVMSHITPASMGSCHVTSYIAFNLSSVCHITCHTCQHGKLSRYFVRRFQLELRLSHHMSHLPAWEVVTLLRTSLSTWAPFVTSHVTSAMWDVTSYIFIFLELFVLFIIYSIPCEGMQKLWRIWKRKNAGTKVWELVMLLGTSLSESRGFDVICLFTQHNMLAPSEPSQLFLHVFAYSRQHY